MSENIDCNLSIGVTETGTIGKDIFIGILSINKDDEEKLLLNNLLYSNHIVNVLGDSDTGKKSKTAIDATESKKFITNLLRNENISINLFRIQPQEQFKLLQEISILEGQRLYDLGKALDSSNYQYLGKSLQLRYQYPKNYIDTFVKSLVQYLALMWVIKENGCGHADLFKDNILAERRMALHILVNGGPQFSSYQDILNENLKNFWSAIKTKESSKFYWNLMIATHGINHANKYYPVVTSIDYILKEMQSNYDLFLYSENTIKDITAEEILGQKNHVDKSILEELHLHYMERTGSTFRPPKLWRIGKFDKIGEYNLTLPYLMLRKSIKEKKITAREVDNQTDKIDRFYQYNNPLDRDAFLVGEITAKDDEVISVLKELGIEGLTIIDEDLLTEYKILLNDLTNYIECDECIISTEDQKRVLDKLAKIEKTDFKKIDKISIPENII
ncbi:MAG: hypothetical protein ACTSPT_02235 [Candidatus Heimdallarchaeota archaeon]